MQLETLADYANYVGHTLAPSPWVKVDQKMIDDFGEVTGDRNWYHVDVERAAREIPGGRTIAHGLLTLSLVPHLASQIVSVRRRGRYGAGRRTEAGPFGRDDGACLRLIASHLNVFAAMDAKVQPARANRAMFGSNAPITIPCHCWTARGSHADRTAHPPICSPSELR
jgi:hypothetical protein